MWWYLVLSLWLRLMDSCGMLFATMVDDVVHGYPSLTHTSQGLFLL
jgi:hypothetical protein